MPRRTIGPPGRGPSWAAPAEGGRRLVVRIDAATLQRAEWAVLVILSLELLAFSVFPKPVWRLIWSNNPLKWLNKKRCDAAPMGSGCASTCGR